ncbi:MAG: M48 family metallopeptidase [Deltaproteobacteria bacterium]|nr:M48 family metallopeptidase [Deltaproteobacteria bacterium]
MSAALRSASTRLCVVLALSSGCATRDYVTGLWTLNRFDEREEVDLGIRQADLLIASAEQLGHSIDPDDEYTRATRRIAHRILTVPENRARMPPFPWEVHVLGASDANAWCFPGGQLIVMTGLLRSGFVRDEHEAAAIIGHEIAHAAARHGTEKETMARIRGALGPLARFFGPRLVELLDPGGAGDVAAALEKTAGEHDQAQELEADLIGEELMARAGYDPFAAPRIWGRIAREPVLETHPPNRLRMSELLRHAPTARWLAQHRTRAREEPAALRSPQLTSTWTWRQGSSFEPIAATTTSTLPLPEGSKLGAAYVRNPAALGISMKLDPDPKGGAVVEVTVEADAGLSDDQLPASGIVFAESGGRVLYAERLWQAQPLEKRLRQRVHLSRLKGRVERLRARVIVGSLWSESEIVLSPER